MRNVLIVTLNTLRITFRKKGSIFGFIILPVLLVLASLFLYSSNTGKLKIGICNLDKGTALSTDFKENLVKSQKFNISDVKEDEIKDKVSNSKVDCVIIIPEDFENSVYDGSLKEVQIISLKGEDTTAFIKNYCDSYIGNLIDMSIASKKDKNTFNKMYENYKNAKIKMKVENVKDAMSSKSATNQSIGFLLMIVLSGSSAISGFIIKEKRERTYYRITASPASGKEYLLGNVIANMLVIIIQTLSIIIFSKYVIKIDTYVPDLTLFIILIIFGLSAVGLGIMIVSFSSSSYQASNLTTLYITPSCMISGCFWPVNVMPNFLQKASNFFPQRWVLSATEKIQGGGSFNDIIMNLGILLGFAAVFFMIGLFNLNRNKTITNFR